MKKVPDYRCDREKPHNHAEMLACIITGYANGRTSVARALNWCKEHIDMLQKYMGLKSGIASESTISRLLKGIDEEMFALVFMEWVAQLLKERGIHIIIDGKALRGATEKTKGGNTPYVLNAIDAATQLVIAQLAISEKTNEITAIPQLLELLDIQDNVFTIDAIGTQKNIERLIVENGGHFVLQVKKNQPTLYEEIITGFEAFEKELATEEKERAQKLKQYVEKYEKWYSQEKNRERIEYREMAVCQDATFLECVRNGEASFVKSVGCATQIRVPVEKDEEGNDITVSKEEFLKKGSHRKPRPQKGEGISDAVQQVGIISDLTLSAEEMAGYKRSHWKIENNLHYELDNVIDEDRSTAKGGKNNLALIRKIAYIVLRLAIIKEHPKWGLQRMMDYFSDHPEKMTKYIFSEIESFY